MFKSQYYIGTITGEIKPIRIGQCQVCKKDIYEDEPHVLNQFHEKCLQKVKETKTHITYRTPSGGMIRIGK